jgi:hypothetical protein
MAFTSLKNISSTGGTGRAAFSAFLPSGPTFTFVNALVIVLGIIAANLAGHCPGIALAFPALMLINATFFHVLPFARTGGRFSPGLITAVVLFYPIGIACYWRASHGGTPRTRALIGSLVLGALLMAMPIVLLKIKNLRYFRQDR